MKKIYLLIAIVGFIGLQSCSGPEAATGKNGLDAPVSQVFEITRSFSDTNSYGTLFTFPQKTYSSDVILAFRLTGKTSNGTDIWKPLPQTFYFANGTLDYQFDFDFTQFDVNIFINGNDLATIPIAFRSNQTFRIVIVPAAFSNRLRSNMSYEEVIAKFNIDDSHVKILK